jgi:glycosyltransferase involved in cell wall biosynthesis
MNKKTVDIIIPCYNTAGYLRESIESALAQTYSPINILVVDDGSTDNTRAVVRSFKGLVKYFYKENGGQASARNAGVVRTNGDYVCLLDADDIILPEMVRTQVDHLEKHLNLDMCYCKTLVFYERNVMRPYAERWRPFVCWKDHLEPLSVICAMDVCSAVIKRSVFEKFGLFPEGRAIQGCEDWFFWLQAAVHGAAFGYVPKVFTLYRQHSSSASSTERAIAVRESELMRRAVKLFDSAGLNDARKRTILAYGMKSVALRWMNLVETASFQKLSALSDGIAPPPECAPEVRELFRQPDAYPSAVLHLALSKGFLDLGHPELAAVMFLKCGDIRDLRSQAIRTGQKRLFDYVVAQMDGLIQEQVAEEPDNPGGRGNPAGAGRLDFPHKIAQSVPEKASFIGHVAHQMGLLALSDNSFDEAEARFNSALRLNRNQCCTHLELVKILGSKRSYVAALSHLREGAAVDINTVFVWASASIGGGFLGRVAMLGQLLRRVEASPLLRRFLKALVSLFYPSK